MTAPPGTGQQEQPARSADQLVLTRIPLNIRHPDVRRDLRDATAMHRRLMGLLTRGLGDSPRAAASALYRIDRDRAPGNAVLLQCKLPPDLELLPTGYSLNAAVSKDIAPALAALVPNQPIAYRILINPTRSVLQPRKADGTPVRGRRSAIPAAQLPNWWTEQATRAGLTCLAIATSFSQEPTVHASRGAAKPAVHAAVRIDGKATITDPDALRDAIVHGIGRGKNHGLGLLSVAPARL